MKLENVVGFLAVGVQVAYRQKARRGSTSSKIEIRAEKSGKD